MKSTVTAFTYDSQRGTLKPIATLSTQLLPTGFAGENTNGPRKCASIRRSKFLYGSNRGHDSIAIFTMDPATGLKPVARRTRVDRRQVRAA